MKVDVRVRITRDDGEIIYEGPAVQDTVDKTMLVSGLFAFEPGDLIEILDNPQ